MTSLDLKNTADILSRLIQCKSVTPNEGGAITMVEQILNDIGFKCYRLKFANIDNLYAEFGKCEPHFCFAGHTDVVPAGDEDNWKYPPFAGIIKDNFVHGRGAVDMKGGIAAFITAVHCFLEKNSNFNGKISFLITGDEEGMAINGTKKLLEWMDKNGKIPNHCLVGEPTNPETLGTMMKVGRRGGLSGSIEVFGTQGHVAYPEFAKNPIPKLLKILNLLENIRLDNGSQNFQPSNLEITSIDVGNNATNIIPATATAMFNIRFNDKHTGNSLIKLLNNHISSLNIKKDEYKITYHISGDSFVTKDKKLSLLITNACKKVINTEPHKSTTGGTSDARFITNYCPVIEFGGVGKTMHKVNEKAHIEDLKNLSLIYENILELYFT